jgi:PhnB protein
MSVKPVPDSYHTVTPYLIVPDVDSVLNFVVKAFAAEVVSRSETPDGKVGHADFVIGDSHVMIGQAMDEWKPMPTMLYLYVEDCDAMYASAIDAGASSMQEPATQFYGDRLGAVGDSQGNMWWIATRVENVPQDELERRAKEMFE